MSFARDLILSIFREISCDWSRQTAKVFLIYRRPKSHWCVSRQQPPLALPAHDAKFVEQLGVSQNVHYTILIEIPQQV